MATDGVRKALGDGAAVFLILNAGATAAASLLALGGALSPLLDVLSHFAWIYLTAALAGAALSLFTPRWGRRLVLLLAFVAVLAVAILIGPAYLADQGPKAPPAAPGQIKVIQLNALRTNTDIGPIADWLVAQRPDIVTVTEARHDLRDLLVKRAGWQVAGGHGELMIFSRDPRIAMVRPTPPRGSKLDFVNATYPSASGPFEVVTTHLEWPTSPLHGAQQADLEDVVARRPGDRLILTGDFNAAPWSFSLRRAERRLRLTRRDAGLATFPAVRRGWDWPWPVLPIDHVYAGAGWATVSVARGPRLSSDHYPLVVVLAPVAGK